MPVPGPRRPRCGKCARPSPAARSLSARRAAAPGLKSTKVVIDPFDFIQCRIGPNDTHGSGAGTWRSFTSGQFHEPLAHTLMRDDATGPGSRLGFSVKACLMGFIRFDVENRNQCRCRASETFLQELIVARRRTACGNGKQGPPILSPSLAPPLNPSHQEPRRKRPMARAVGRLLVDSLEAHDIDLIYCVPGGNPISASPTPWPTTIACA